LYRCEVISGNHKIAVDPAKSKQTLIESRGQGGYIVGVGSPLEVHSSGQPYEQVYGPELPYEIPTVTPDERLELWKAARTFDKDGLLKAELAKAQPKPCRFDPSDGDAPWKQFDRSADWIAMLQADGWTSHDGEHWTRPGKTFGTSATLRQATGGDLVLVVFSSNAPIPVGTHSASSYLAHSRFGGCFKSACRAIREGVR
jgi:putative DNA primase/helicase